MKCLDCRPIGHMMSVTEAIIVRHNYLFWRRCLETIMLEELDLLKTPHAERLHGKASGPLTKYTFARQQVRGKEMRGEPSSMLEWQPSALRNQLAESQYQKQGARHGC